MAYLYELEGIYAQLESLDLNDEIFQDTLDSIDFQKDLEKNLEMDLNLARTGKEIILKSKSN